MFQPTGDHTPLLSGAKVWSQIDLLRAAMRQSTRAAGKLGQAAEYGLSAGGKFFRARLAFVSCNALDVPLPQALELAKVCELLHQASLVHDDVQDADVMRRNRLSVWRRFGVNEAVSAGDYLLTLAFAAIGEIDAPDSVRVSLLRLVSRRIIDVIRGQSMDQDITDPNGVTIEQYDETARLKTGPLLALPVEGALLLSGAVAEDLLPATRALFWLGAGYQVRDDILDFCDSAKGREAGSDLRQGRPNAVILHFLSLVQSAEKSDLLMFLRKPRHMVEGTEVLEWVTKLRGSPAFRAAIRHATHLVELSHVDRLDLPGELASVIREVAWTLNPPVEPSEAARSEPGLAADLWSHVTGSVALS